MNRYTVVRNDVVVFSAVSQKEAILKAIELSRADATAYYIVCKDGRECEIWAHGIRVGFSW